MKFYRKPEALIKIIYKSGAVHEFWASKFDAKVGDGGLTHTTYNCPVVNRPIYLGLTQVAAVWQIDLRSVWRFE